MAKKVMFDSNVWQKVVCPEDYTDDPQYEELCKVNEKIKSGEIEPYISETVFTLENVQKKQRKEKFGNMESSIRTKFELKDGGIHMRIEMGPNSENAVSLDDNPKLKKYAEKALGLGFRIVRGPRIGMFECKDLDDKLYQVPNFNEYNEKLGEVGAKIEAHGAGKNQLDMLVSSNAGASISERIKAAPEDEAKKIAKAIAEWADGDSVAMCIALGCDYFCSRDQAKGAGTASVMSAANLVWLESDYGFKVVGLDVIA